MSDTDKYEGHTPAPWNELLSVGVEDQEGWDALLELGFNDEARLLIADAPLLLEEVKQLHHALLYVTAKIYMNENGEPYDYEQLMGYCRGQIGEPDDMSGHLGRLLHEWSEEE